MSPATQQQAVKYLEVVQRLEALVVLDRNQQSLLDKLKGGAPGIVWLFEDCLHLTGAGHTTRCATCNKPSMVVSLNLLLCRPEAKAVAESVV